MRGRFVGAGPSTSVPQTVVRKRAAPPGPEPAPWPPQDARQPDLVARILAMIAGHVARPAARRGRAAPQHARFWRGGRPLAHPGRRGSIGTTVTRGRKIVAPTVGITPSASACRSRGAKAWARKHGQIAWAQDTRATRRMSSEQDFAPPTTDSSCLAHELRLQLHRPDAIDLAVDVVIAIDQADVAHLGPDFHHLR